MKMAIQVAGELVEAMAEGDNVNTASWSNERISACVLLSLLVFHCIPTSSYNFIMIGFLTLHWTFDNY